MNPSYLVLDNRKMAAFQIASDLCHSIHADDTFLDELWQGLLAHPLLYDEFVYYLEKQELTGHFTCEGYSMPDLYFYELRSYGTMHDVSKDNSAAGNKDEIAVRAFHTMVMLTREPEKYKPLLEKYNGMDML